MKVNEANSRIAALEARNEKLEAVAVKAKRLQETAARIRKASMTTDETGFEVGPRLMGDLDADEEAVRKALAALEKPDGTRAERTEQRLKKIAKQEGITMPRASGRQLTTEQMFRRYGGPDGKNDRD